MANSSSASGSGSGFRSRFGDTTLTKVFVGGLAWETPTEELHKYFAQFGDILESVIITDRATGRSKGYGFVTFRDADSARRSVADPNPFIDGRRANCNIASMGRPRASSSGGYQTEEMYQGQQQYLPFQAGQLHPQPPLLYPHVQYGYIPNPSDYAYQQAYYNHTLTQQYYPQQLYGPMSTPSTPGQPFYPFAQIGYVPGSGPGYQSTQQGPSRTRQTHIPTHPPAQIEGSNFNSSLPPNFQLQLPPRARQERSNTIDSEESQPGPSSLEDID